MLNPPLTDVEVRILGSLAEKAVTTPDNYPLSVSALAAACNQTTSREPVMKLDEGLILESIVTLRRRSLLRAIQPSGSRVTKYLHLLGEALDLNVREVAVLGVLLLRGPQTVGELFTRTTRLAEFQDVTAIEATLNALISREAGELVALMPKRAGQKEARYAQLLSGEPAVDADKDTSSDLGAAAVGGVASTVDRVGELERVVAELRSELVELQTQFAAFRAEFQ